MPTTITLHESLPPRHDATIRDHAKELLQSCGYPSLARLDCHVFDGIVELHGDVPSYYLKQLAQAVVLTMAGNQEVRNYLRVQ